MAEQTLVDSHTGRIMNPRLAEYHPFRAVDIPPIDVPFLDDPDLNTPLGAGEVDITGRAPAKSGR